MRVLLVKLTSMGDVIHTLPALTDAAAHIPDIRFDWVIDQDFAQIAGWHPAINKIIPSAHRQWRKHFWKKETVASIKQFLTALRQEKYDVIIDAQSGLKSAFVTWLAKGTKHGLDKQSAREWPASYFYHKKHHIAKTQHAVTRLRSLFSHVFGYLQPQTPPDYGIAHHAFPPLQYTLPKPYVVFVQNASWHSKLLPEAHWRALIQLADDAKFHVLLTAGNAMEKQRAQRISAGFDNATALPFCTLSEYAAILQGAQGAICSDTGIGQLATALNVPALTFYGPTSEQLVGTMGPRQAHAVSPFPCVKCYQRECRYENKMHENALCLADISPEKLWEGFKQIYSI